MNAIPAFPAKQIEKNYEQAKRAYAGFEVDTDEAIQKALKIPISLHCWQTDDVEGLEKAGQEIAGAGIMATGNYPGKARNGDEIREDLARVIALLPGVQRTNLHAMYAETDGPPIGRDEQVPENFSKWIEWAKGIGIALDFNTT